MILPSKVYDILKFLVRFIPLLVTFVGTVALVLGASEQTVNIILVILGAVGTLVEGLIEICKANHYKFIAEDGAVYYIDDVGKETGADTTTTETTATGTGEPEPEEYIKKPTEKGGG